MLLVCLLVNHLSLSCVVDLNVRNLFMLFSIDLVVRDSFLL